ncbi:MULTISPECIES: aminopeptidase N [unclassified Cupriavidus]|uniref:aminopeptidase N n=1 Tax=unclassified Cupriavidus TaxID=2640874 RepID=UPI001C006BAD|nr:MULTISPECIES: aminopeptidase N [unclassified Cupriavidus]MCA3187514.1 aminopeptidase N [Cupriavidus sp.]MCA3191433.1 aminopeptidase N [Cupriavidus sp.]MCA3196537.1 aminopeptidase N [Cupriavidus sp.]MCA3203117.1 aminopeptidase N [Cupriavidus sp.]QWE95138.1 aminopeptidase N [Cupriavidus sp. EM10]
MLRTDTPVTVYRKDYTPPAFAVDHVDLVLDIDPQRTIVTSTLKLQRTGPADAPLVLSGEALELIGITLDGQPFTSYRADGDTLTLTGLPTQGTLEITAACNPAANTTLSGLYVSNGNFFTQCEAEGFRRITYFLDRPDVMTTYRVTLRADRAACPVLLSNGNLLSQSDLPDGRHEAVWEDPFRKPSYLFALVAGKLECIEEKIVSASGKEKLLQVWVEPQDLDKTRHAMDSLIHSIRWDERRFGLELDLDRFMIVAVGDFNMGAMENKGLNIFNTKYVLANAQTATDVDFANIESVVAHEYFHNWTGNRVTCRDWFQLSLKEGLTVFRDQEFSADMMGSESGRAVKRIEDVRVLRQVQFPEDAGPMAHPVRPDSYEEINNFYTVTVYEKGAEVVRMYQTLLGRDGFRRGMDLYFKRHDGQAVTCDDFRAAMADANGRDLKQFDLWYSQAGTPVVSAKTQWDADAGTLSLTLTQRCPKVGIETKAGTPDKQPFHIPFALGLIDAAGNDLPLQLDGEAQAAGTTRVLDFTQAEQTFRFVGLPKGAKAPLPSLLRNFSAPVIVDYEYTDAELTFLLAHDSDAFNRWEAGQRLATRALLQLVGDVQAQRELKLDPALVAAFRTVLTDGSLNPAFREQALMLPAEAYLAERMGVADPAAIHRARLFMREGLARALKAEWLAAYEANATPGDYSPDADSMAKRALRNLALGYLADSGDADMQALADRHYQQSDNMTDRFAALSALVNSFAPGREHALADFYERFEDDALVIDKWFSLQGMQRGEVGPHAGKRTIDTVRALMEHPAFNLRNPNRARSLIFSFCSGNPAQFHAADGSGYEFWADQVLALDAINPQVAARLARVMDRWQKYEIPLRDRMRAALERVAAASTLSRDVREIVGKSLAS